MERWVDVLEYGMVEDTNEHLRIFDLGVKMSFDKNRVSEGVRDELARQ